VYFLRRHPHTSIFFRSSISNAFYYTFKNTPECCLSTSIFSRAAPIYCLPLHLIASTSDHCAHSVLDLYRHLSTLPDAHYRREVSAAKRRAADEWFARFEPRRLERALRLAPRTDLSGAHQSIGRTQWQVRVSESVWVFVCRCVYVCV
jgi:hypothetical protein